MKKEWKRLVSNFFALWAKKKIKKAKRIIKQHLTLNLRLKKEKKSKLLQFIASKRNNFTDELGVNALMKTWKIKRLLHSCLVL